MKKINITDIKFFSSLNVDPLGRCGIYEKRILRVVKNEKREYVLKLLSSDFYKEAVSQNLLLKSTIVEDLYLDDEHFILETEYIENSPKPYEWSFSMLKDAAIVVAKLFKLCEEYGFYMLDGHPYNIVFKYSTPVWCDLGTFIEGSEVSGEDEFIRDAYWPLLLWSRGHDYLANSLLRSQLFSRLLHNQRKIPSYRSFVLKNSLILAGKIVINKIMYRFSGKKIFRIRFGKILLKSIERISYPSFNTRWSNYQNTDFSNTVQRFERIVDLIKENCKDIESAVDLAGNQGFLANALIKNGIVNNAVSVDYDAVAVDKLYNSLKESNLNITPMVGNIIGEYEPLAVHADVAIAMAVTHHLMLTQNISLDFILKEISRFSNKYVVIEFMPLGLWNGKHAPVLPDWYSEKYFAEIFENHFTLITKEKLEENRIVYIGKKTEYAGL